MALDPNRSVDQMIADLEAMTQNVKEGRASKPRLSFPDFPVGNVQGNQQAIEDYQNASSPIMNFLGNTLNTITAPINYGLLNPLAEYGDIARWTDPNKTFLEKAAYNPFSKGNELLAEGWKKDGFFGAVGELSEKGASGGDVIANISSGVTYDALQQLYPEDQEKNRQFVLEMRKNFREESPVAYYGGGLGFEIVTDPLNLLTLGGASVLKAGAKASLKEANAIAKSAGAGEKFKTVEEAVDAVYNKTIDKYSKLKQTLPKQAQVLEKQTAQAVKKNTEAEVNRIMQAAIKKGVDPAKAKTLARQAVEISEEPAQTVNRIEKLASEARQKAVARINDAAKAARAKAQNRLLSLDVPLTNKTIPLLNKPAFMQRTAEKVGESATGIVANLTELLQPTMRTSYKVNPTTNAVESVTEIAQTAKDRMDELLKTRYGVTKPEDLTIDALRDLQDLFAKRSQQSKTFGLETKTTPKMVDETLDEMQYVSPNMNQILSQADPKVVNIVRNLLGKDVDPKQIPQILGDNRTLLNIDNATLKILPDLIRQEAKALGKDVSIPTPKPVPASIVNRFDQLFEASTKLGLENRTYEDAFKSLVDEFNSGKITAQELSKKLADDLKSAKDLIKEQQPKPAPKSKQPKPVPSETPAPKQKSTHPSNIITPEKKAYFAELRKNLQPTGTPQVVKGIDKELVKQLEKIAKQLEKQVPTAKIVTKPVLDATGKARKIDVGVPKVIKKIVNGEEVYKQVGRTFVPFEQLRNMPSFVQDMGGYTPLGRWYRSTLLSKLFTARSLGVKDSFVNSYGDLIQQAKTMKAGELRFMERDLVKLSNMAQDMSEEELRVVQYLVENKFPKSYSQAQIDAFKSNQKLAEFSNIVTNLMKYVGQEEKTAGILGKLRQDYFPHILKFNENSWENFAKRYQKDSDLAGLIGKGQSNSFSKQRIGVPTLAELDDALASLHTKLENATDARQIANLERKISELENIFNRDTLQAVASRVYTSARSRMMKQLYDQMRKDRLLRYTVPSRRPQDFIIVTADEARVLGLKTRQGAEQLYIHKDVMNALKQIEDVFTDDRLNNAIKAVDDVTKLWRLSTTVLIPKHYVNNLIGNVFNNAIAGVNPAEYKNAAKVLSDLRKGKLSEADSSLVKEAYRDGIIGQGHNAEFEFFADPNKVKSWAERTNEKVRSWRYTKFLMYAGQWIDDVSRLALYMDTLKKTKSQKIAADRVREYLFNYHEVTQADKIVRSVFMPFWLWTKNNLPLQMRSLFTNPRVYAITDNMRQATFDERDFDDDPDFVREKYVQNFLGQKVPLSLPMYDVNKIEGFQGTLQNFGADLSPFVRAIPELALNKEFFTGAPIDKEANRRGAEGLSNEKVAQYLTKSFGGQVGSWVTDTYKKVVEEDKLTLDEQLERVLSSYFYGMPYYEK